MRIGWHRGTLGLRARPVGAVAHAARLRDWRAALASAVVAALGLAFVLVVVGASRQGEQRRRAQGALSHAIAACEAFTTHQERARCRAGLHPLPRDSADLARWTPRGP